MEQFLSFGPVENKLDQNYVLPFQKDLDPYVEGQSIRLILSTYQVIPEFRKSSMLLVTIDFKS